jgi:hypothetical protein
MRESLFDLSCIFTFWVHIEYFLCFKCSRFQYKMLNFNNLHQYLQFWIIILYRKTNKAKYYLVINIKFIYL